jgi:8-oxo-dGTP diphosphatase
MTRIHLATGIAIRDGALLLVASVYPSQAQPVWGLPGGRQRTGETLAQTLLREVAEETGMHAAVAEFAYLSESYAGDVHVLNASFEMQVYGDPRIPERGDHVVAVEWCPLERIESRMTLHVAREPLLQYLRAGRRYCAYPDAGVTVTWDDEA